MRAGPAIWALLRFFFVYFSPDLCTLLVDIVDFFVCFLTDFLETPTKGVELFFTVIALLKSKKSKVHLKDFSLNYFW